MWWSGCVQEKYPAVVGIDRRIPWLAGDWDTREKGVDERKYLLSSMFLDVTVTPLDHPSSSLSPFETCMHRI